MEEYHGDTFLKDGYIYFEINKVIYGLPQAGSLANKFLQKILTVYGFIPTPRTPGLWRNKTRPIKLALVVYGFVV